MFSEYCDNEHYNILSCYNPREFLELTFFLQDDIFVFLFVDCFEVDREGCSLSYLFLSHNHAYHVADATIVGTQMVNGTTTTKTNYKNSP